MDIIIRHKYVQTADTKRRTIIIDKNDLYADIDALTYKYAEASSVEAPKIINAMQSDSSENLDGHILSRNIEFRDAKIRQLIQFAIADEALRPEEVSSLDLTNCITYTLDVPVELKDALLDSVQVYIHRYIVWGALYDWYASGMGSQQAAVYASQLVSLETDILNAIRARCVAKRAMQPFGPAYKML